MLGKMEKLGFLLRIVLCVFCCGYGNASPTLIPPGLLDSLKSEEDMGYLLTMPQKLHAGSVEQYCLTLHGVTKDTTITLELVDLEREEAEAATFTHTYINGQSQCKNFVVPNVPGRYEVNLQNETDTFATSEVTVLGDNLITFVQTDKPIYKPGQKVKFRILTMTRNLRSRVGKIENVFIKDPNDFKVKRFANTDSKGMASLEFQLIKEAKLGTWTIEVTVEGETTTQTFKVEEYVLPRFEVTVTTQPYFLVSDNTFSGTVCAKYTYGKPVQAFLNLRACPTGYGSFGSPCALRQADINGCYEFSFNTSELLDEERYYYRRSFSFDATVTEMGTGIQVNGSAASPPLSHNPLKMEFVDDTNGYFKPGMPILGKVKVTKPDGSPAANETILVSTSDHRNDIYMDRTFITDSMGEVHYSICHGFLDNTTSLTMDAEAVHYQEDMNIPYERRIFMPRAYKNFRQWFSPSMSYIQIPARPETLKCGASLDLNVPFTHDGRSPYVTFYYQVLARGRIVQAGTKDAATVPDPLSFLDVGVNNCLEVKERPTPPPRPTVPPVIYPINSSIEIAPNVTDLEEPLIEDFEENPREPPAVMEPPLLPEEEPVRIQPLFESVGDDLKRKRRSIMPPYGHGEEEPIVRSEHISNQVSGVELSIPVTSEMSPKFSVLLYYIREDGETVADSMEFKVEPCLDNKVKMEFGEEKVRPGAETTIHLEASAGSVCGVGVVDKSVNILAGDHQITPSKVFEKLAQYSLSSMGGYSYHYFRSDYDYCKERMAKFEKEEEKEEEEEEEGEERPPWDYDMHLTYSSNYVDAIQAFKQMGMLVLTNLEVETRPCSWSYPIVYGPSARANIPAESIQGLPGPPGGGPLNVMPVMRRVSAPEKEEKTRSDFPETWLWDLQMIGDSGKLDYPVTAPHTITQWVGNSLCIDERTGFGLSPVTSLTTFQPFFLNMNLPYNAVRGERLPITVTVYNYLDKCLHMELTVDGKEAFKVHSFIGHKEPFCLCGGESKTKKYYITARDIGQLPIFARARIIPGQCGNEAKMDMQYVNLSDAVLRKVLVKAEGVTQRYSHSLYICPKDGESSDSEISLPLPVDIVSDSARGDVTVIGDIMGPALSNLDHLVRMPTGCGEQNMVGFTPNIYVLKYLGASGGLTEIMEDKIKNFMEIGYQRELTYRHPDGSFSAYGPSGEKPGSTWLTAFVVKSFAQAKPYIFIDEKDLELSKDYLKSMQNPEGGPLMGCFFERGQVFSSYMQGGMGRDASDAVLSAYVLIALLEAGLDKEDPVAVTAIDCINRNLRPDEDVYTLTLVAFANVLYNPESPFSSHIMMMLDNKATVDGDLRYWKRAGEVPKPVNSWYYYAAPSAEVEMTSYALMAILKHSSEEDAVGRAQPTVYWLSQQRNAFGGYSSTQDTVLGLNALSEFALKTISNQPSNLRVLLQDGVSLQTELRVNETNRLILQRRAFPVTGDTTMQVSIDGTGCALVQANVHYNKVPARLGIDNPKFSLSADPRNYQHDRNRCDRRTVYITFGQSSRDQFSSGMTMLTVRMVTGWYPIPESLRELRSRYPMLGIQREEIDEEQGVINFYLDELDMRSRRFALDVEQDQDLLISATKPAEVQIYQYYEKDVTVIKSYELRTTCGTKLSIPYDAPDPGDEDIIMQRRVPVNQGSPNELNIGASRGQPSEGGPRRPATPQPRQPATPQPSGGNCPVCNLRQVPDNYHEIVCSSTAVYKAHVGRNRKYSMKIKANLRPHQKQRNLSWFANVRMSPGCECALLDPPQRKVLIITQSENLDMRTKTLTVDARTYVFDLRRNKPLEKEARRAQKKCRMD